MTHLSSQQNLCQEPDLTQVQVKQLISIAGDHTATEAEWVQACLLLGDRQPELPRKKRNRRLALILCSVVLVSVGGLWYGTGKAVDTSRVYDQLATSPVAIAPAPGIPEAAAPPLAGRAVEVAPDYGNFMHHIQRRIKRHWRPSSSDVSRHITVLFKVNLDGEVSDLRVKDSSGVDTADAAALKAVETAAPFEHLPAGANEAVDIQFTFDYNVFQNNQIHTH